jgi:phage-related minor tail protein
MPAQRIMELEAQLSAARESISHLTKANAELTAGLKAAEVAFKRVRRTARQDGNTLRDQITTLQSRRF